MCKKLTSLLIATSLVLFLCGASVANSRRDEESRRAEKVKAGIAKLGTGSSASVEVRLRDKTKVKGYVHEISENYFVVIDYKTGAATTVSYSQVKQVKGNNLSTGAKIAIGIGVVALLVLFAMAVSEDAAGP